MPKPVSHSPDHSGAAAGSDGERPLTRRGFLAATGAAGLGSVAGCLSGGTDVSVLAAGSLVSLFQEAVGPAFERSHEYGYRGEFHGSNAVLRMVLERQKRPDVVVSADASLLRKRLPEELAPWDVVFASNALVIAYNPNTAVGRKLEAGKPWYAVLRRADAEIARADPDLDPLGYRAILMFKLAEARYGIEGLAGDLRENLVVDPQEAQLLAGVETGNRAAAIVYKNMAVEHDLPYVSLPDALNFSDPDLAEYYARVSYTTEDGTTVRGSPIRYNLTVPTTATHPEAGRTFAAFLLANPDLLRENGLIVDERFPQPNGPVPPEVLP
ncbi:MAG: extracellular solute-binding protein [Halodesulfurarchaeum sp.]